MTIPEGTLVGVMVGGKLYVEPFRAHPQVPPIDRYLRTLQQIAQTVDELTAPPKPRRWWQFWKARR
ncbi:hypothetical protein BN970_01340 [Mycolicibacterium conceptionense]|uniref:Uncharacterized protein n=1 Tax=Mycolicibacterium conceptionense TaxID=451644 RepID=A0A0U1D2V6_9MYCO|nr:hypothetical protein [Mycolicibacterium conceptionense]ORV20943.1 hypothetical protein AWB98_01195 [Mycolicibacterium conceptionense]CQD07148.1 hypothetical protein BN970_01340 [Mycolicibacterium conceptionense]